MIRHCLDSLYTAGIKDIVTVLSPEQEQIRQELIGLAVRIAINDKPGSDMAESVRVGLACADSSTTGVMVCLADHPLVTAETIEAIVRTHSVDRSKIIIPVYEGRRGHPTLFPKKIAGEIYSGINLREIVRKDPSRVRCLDLTDHGIVSDIDTMEDYEAALREAHIFKDGKGR